MTDRINRRIDIEQPLTSHVGVASLPPNKLANPHHTQGAANKVDIIQLHRAIQDHQSAQRMGDHVDISSKTTHIPDSLINFMCTFILDPAFEKVLDVAQSIVEGEPLKKFIHMII